MSKNDNPPPTHPIHGLWPSLLCPPVLSMRRYVYTFKRFSLDNARAFAFHHSFPKLALSLKPCWSRGTTELNKQANELKWQECVLSLLEVRGWVPILHGRVFWILRNAKPKGLTAFFSQFRLRTAAVPVRDRRSLNENLQPPTHAVLYLR